MSFKAKVMLLAFALAFILQISSSHGYDVLMVVGGMYVEQSVGYTLKAVEVIGLNSVCQSYSLPEQRHSLFGGRLSDRAIVCGGNDGSYERSECFVLHNNANGRWQRMTPDLGQPLIFAAAAGEGRSNFYVIGGRRYNFDNHFWDYQTEARVYNKRDNQWRNLQPLANPISNGCLLVLGSTLILSGGAKHRYVYADDPSKVYTLNVSDPISQWRDDKIPEMLGNRMWHGCTFANIENEISLLVAGGYYNGRATMSIPLTSLLEPNLPKPQWSYLGYLEQERQWGPALGLVGGKPTIATGKNYGDVTLDTLENEYHWMVDRNRELRYKREFVVALTVPHTWFPSHCNF